MVIGNIKDRFYGAWWGAFIGDAMSMPTHGYSSRQMIFSDYGNISDYMAPRDVHPESVLHTLPIPELPAEFDYIGKERAAFGALFSILSR